jgi:hypothetical protein
MSEGGNVAIDTEYRGANGEHGKGEVFEHASRMVDEARAFGSALSGSIENLSQALDLRGRVERNPIGMMFAALGVGYVLGGGLFSPTTARLLRIGARLALVPIIKSQLNAFSGGAGERTSESGAI